LPIKEGGQFCKPKDEKLIKKTRRRKERGHEGGVSQGPDTQGKVGGKMVFGKSKSPTGTSEKRLRERGGPGGGTLAKWTPILCELVKEMARCGGRRTKGKEERSTGGNKGLRESDPTGLGENGERKSGRQNAADGAKKGYGKEGD